MFQGTNGVKLTPRRGKAQRNKGSSPGLGAANAHDQFKPLQGALHDLFLGSDSSLPVGLESELCFQLPQIAKKQASTSGAGTGFGSSKAAVSSLWQAGC